MKYDSHGHFVWDVDLLRELVENKKISQASVGAILGSSQQAVCRACHRFGIKSPGNSRPRRMADMGKIGKRIQNSDGYILIYMPDHPMAMTTNNGRKTYVLEHRMVMSEYLGRVLGKDEVVHHKNRDKKDNRLENLELISRLDHSYLHDKEGDNRKRIWSENGLQNMQLSRHRGNLLGIMTDPKLLDSKKNEYIEKLRSSLVCPLLYLGMEVR